MDVFDAQGRNVGSLGHGPRSAGRHTIAWNARLRGGATPGGLYFVRFRHPGGQAVRRLVLAR